jgi:hypothetical protein
VAFQPGEVVEGRFTILEEIGRGGMGTVYRASQPAVNRLVALKVLPRHLAGDPSFYARFNREARLIAGLEHPHVLPVYDFGQHNGQAYLVTRYIEGGTLFDELRYAPLRLDRALQLINQIAAALDYAHQHGVIHRDIKPSNILIDRSGNAYVADFGIAKALETTTGLTGSGIIGTPEYMAPEQAQGYPVDGRTDVYSLGVMLFQMLTGRLPFATPQGDAISLAYKHIAELPPSPRQLNPALLPELDGVVLKALAKDPALRYPTAGGLAQAMRAVMDAEAVQRAAASLRPAVTPRPPSAPAQPAAATLSEKMVSVALAGGAAGGLMFLAGLLIAVAGAFTGANTAGGATVTAQDIGTPLVSALVVGLAAALLRLMRVMLPRSGCLSAGLHGAFGLAIGLAAAIVGYVAYLVIIPGDRIGLGVGGILGSLVAVFNLIGLSAIATSLVAGLAGPTRRARGLLWNGLAVALPLALGFAAAGPALYAAYAGSAGVPDFLRLALYFAAQPAMLVAGLVVAELAWRYD